MSNFCAGKTYIPPSAPTVGNEIGEGLNKCVDWYRSYLANG